MDFLRRAFSLPQLFKDWDKSVKRKRAREQEVDELKVKRHFRRSCARRLSKTWSRLVESRSTGRIFPVGEDDGSMENRRAFGKSQALAKSCTEIRSKNRAGQDIHVTGSSCDLAPTLLSIYDNYGSVTTSQEISNNVTSSGDKVNDREPTSASKINISVKQNHRQSSLQCRHTRQKSRSCQNVNWNGEERVIVEINGNMDDHEDVQMKDVEGVTPTITISTDPVVGLKDNARVTNITLCPVVGDGIASCTPHLQDGCCAVAGGINRQLTETDAKKRPLSISSTSSSVSSSSLPRHQKKKVATSALLSSSILNSEHRCETSKDHQDSNSNFTGQNSTCSSPQKSPCHIVSGVGTDNNKQLASESYVDSSSRTTPCTSCRHSRTGFNDHNHICDITEVNELNTSDILDSPGQDLNRSLSDPGGGGHAVVTAPPKSPSVSSTHSHRFVLDFGASYLSKVVHEVMETERIYVNDLRDIIQGYIGYLDSTCDLTIEQEDKKALFGNIGEIYNFNRDFLEHLEQCDLDPVQVAQCFVDRSEGFLIYTDYCTNYPRSMEVLTVIMQDKHLSDVFKRQQMNLHHALPLGSYLLKPVQRILKYHLFLQNMLNNFDKCRVGHEAVIAEAFESMTNIAQHINEMKRQHERAVHIQEIQSMLFGWDKDDLTTYGELVLEDHFRMHGAKAHRLLYLFQKMLIIAKRKEDGNLLVKGSIKCSDLMLVESIPKEPLSFHVIPFSNPRMQYTVQAKNLDHKHKWCQEIKRLMIDNFQAVIPDKAKQLMMMLGKSKEEEDFDEKSTEDTGLSKKQHTAPEYLERRRQRRKSTSIIPDFALLKNRRARRQNEEGSNSPARTNHSKPREGGMFVSYLSQKPAAADVMEEEEDMEGLSEAPSSPRGSSKSSTLESKSHSLESLQDLSACHGTLPPFNGPVSPKSPSCKRNSGQYFMDMRESGENGDLGCKAARRASRVGSEDLLVAEKVTASDKQKQEKSDASHVQSAASAADKEGSPLRRGESYRKAYELNRLDSVKLAHRRLSRSSDGEDVGEKKEGHMDVAVDQLDDGYVGVMYDQHGVTLPIVGESSTDDPDYVRINLPDPGESTTDPNEDHTEPPNHEIVSQLGAQVIANSHTEKHDKRLIPKGAISYVSKHGALVVKNSRFFEESSSSKLMSPVSASSHDDTAGGITVEPDISSPRKFNSPFCNNSLQYSGHCDNGHFPDNKTVGRTSSLEHVLANSYITSTPVTVNTCFSVHSSPLHTARTGLSSSVYSVSNVGSPVRMSSDLKNGISQSKLEVSHNMDTSDPWILRAEALRPCNSANCRKKLSQPVLRQHSMSAVDARNRIKQKKRISKLYRSNSCASLDENNCETTEKRNKERPHSSHKRVSSDTSTLVFANKSAFLASDYPHVIKYSPEIQRTVARLGTPPREMGPDHLLEEIGECRNKGKVVTRYATPPREVMDAELLQEGTVFENNYTCALEKEILENLRQNVQDSSITSSEPDKISPSRSRSSSGFLPQISKLLKSVGNTPSTSPLVTGHSEKSDHNKEMWEALQKHAHKSSSPDTSTTPVLTQSAVAQGASILSSPISRPGSFHGGASHISVTPLAHSTPGTQTPLSCTSSTVLTNDSIVDSLKNAVISFTSKITRRNPRSVEASPVRLAPRRARSLGAEEDARIRPGKDVLAVNQQKPPKSTREISKEKKEVKRNKFVYHLARAYSERIKKNKIETDMVKGLPSSYIQTGSKLSLATVDVPPYLSASDIKTVGERMAHSKPNILGTYTLRKHSGFKRNPVESSMDIHVDSELESVETSSGEGGTITGDNRGDDKCASSKLHMKMPFLPSDAMDISHGSESDLNEETVSLDCYYERELNDALGQLEEGCRDSAIYSDDGAVNNQGLDCAAPGTSTGKSGLVEIRSSLCMAGKKSEIKPSEKSQGVKDIVKSLEAASKGSTSIPTSPVSEPSVCFSRKNSSPLQMNADDLRSVKMSPLSVHRHRVRELHEVAMFSRIRQNSFDDLDEDETEKKPVTSDCKDESISGESEGSTEEDLTKPKIGWVKQVVSQIQGASVCS